MPPEARPSSCGRQHRSVGRDRCSQLENLWLSDITVKDRGVAWTTSSTDGQAAGIAQCPNVDTGDSRVNLTVETNKHATRIARVPGGKFISLTARQHDPTLC
jgi:hypothetical protein